MQITVTNTSATLRSLLATSGDLALAETNMAGSKGYNVTLYNADSTSTDIVYFTYGETATASEGLPLFSPAGSGTAGDSFSFATQDLDLPRLKSNVASTTVNVLITPLFY